MREILFRGKRNDNGEWVEGRNIHTVNNEDGEQMYIAQTDTPCAIFTSKEHSGVFMSSPAFRLIPETVGQCTDLTDKNGKKIFEGDICRFREWSNGDMCWIGKVNYEHQQFVISGGKNKECATPFTIAMSRFIPENIEVIGNIHDNPELLKGGEG